MWRRILGIFLVVSLLIYGGAGGVGIDSDVTDFRGRDCSGGYLELASRVRVVNEEIFLATVDLYKDLRAFRGKQDLFSSYESLETLVDKISQGFYSPYKRDTSECERYLDSIFDVFQEKLGDGFKVFMEKGEDDVLNIRIQYRNRSSGTSIDYNKHPTNIILKDLEEYAKKCGYKGDIRKLCIELDDKILEVYNAEYNDSQEMINLSAVPHLVRAIMRLYIRLNSSNFENREIEQLTSAVNLIVLNNFFKNKSNYRANPYRLLTEVYHFISTKITTFSCGVSFDKEQLRIMLKYIIFLKSGKILQWLESYKLEDEDGHKKLANKEEEDNNHKPRQPRVLRLWDWGIGLFERTDSLFEVIEDEDSRARYCLKYFLPNLMYNYDHSSKEAIKNIENMSKEAVERYRGYKEKMKDYTWQEREETLKHIIYRTIYNKGFAGKNGAFKKQKVKIAFIQDIIENLLPPSIHNSIYHYFENLKNHQKQYLVNIFFGTAGPGKKNTNKKKKGASVKKNYNRKKKKKGGKKGKNRNKRRKKGNASSGPKKKGKEGILAIFKKKGISKTSDHKLKNRIIDVIRDNKKAVINSKNASLYLVWEECRENEIFSRQLSWQEEGGNDQIAIILTTWLSKAGNDKIYDLAKSKREYIYNTEFFNTWIDALFRAYKEFFKKKGQEDKIYKEFVHDMYNILERVIGKNLDAYKKYIKSKNRRMLAEDLKLLFNSNSSAAVRHINTITKLLLTDPKDRIFREYHINIIDASIREPNGLDMKYDGEEMSIYLDILSDSSVYDFKRCVALFQTLNMKRLVVHIRGCQCKYKAVGKRASSSFRTFLSWLGCNMDKDPDDDEFIVLVFDDYMMQGIEELVVIMQGELKSLVTVSRGQMADTIYSEKFLHKAFFCGIRDNVCLHRGIPMGLMYDFSFEKAEELGMANLLLEKKKKDKMEKSGSVKNGDQKRDSKKIEAQEFAKFIGLDKMKVALIQKKKELAEKRIMLEKEKARFLKKKKIQEKKRIEEEEKYKEEARAKERKLREDYLKRIEKLKAKDEVDSGKNEKIKDMLKEKEKGLVRKLLKIREIEDGTGKRKMQRKLILKERMGQETDSRIDSMPEFQRGVHNLTQLKSQIYTIFLRKDDDLIQVFEKYINKYKSLKARQTVRIIGRMVTYKEERYLREQGINIIVRDYAKSSENLKTTVTIINKQNNDLEYIINDGEVMITRSSQLDINILNYIYDNYEKDSSNSIIKILERLKGKLTSHKWDQYIFVPLIYLDAKDVLRRINDCMWIYGIKTDVKQPELIMQIEEIQNMRRAA